MDFGGASPVAPWQLSVELVGVDKSENERCAAGSALCGIQIWSQAARDHWGTSADSTSIYFASNQSMNVFEHANVATLNLLLAKSG